METQLAPPRQKTPGPWGTVSHLVSLRQLRTRAKIATRTAALTLQTVLNPSWLLICSTSGQPIRMFTVCIADVESGAVGGYGDLSKVQAGKERNQDSNPGLTGHRFGSSARALVHLYFVSFSQATWALKALPPSRPLVWN